MLTILMEESSLLVTLAASMTPMGELRLAIPLAIYSLGVPWYAAMPVACIGNMVPVLILLFGLGHIARILQSLPGPSGRLLKWHMSRLERAQSSRYDRYGALLLVILVSIPLPFTGAWTGSLVAYIFGVPTVKALMLIGTGVIIAGTLVTGLTMSGMFLENYAFSN